MIKGDVDSIFASPKTIDLSVAEEAEISLIIYHECLHQKFYGHTKEFRNKEHLYPNFQEYENFLDYKLKDYNIEYAM